MCINGLRKWTLPSLLLFLFVKDYDRIVCLFRPINLSRNILNPVASLSPSHVYDEFELTAK